MNPNRDSQLNRKSSQGSIIYTLVSYFLVFPVFRLFLRGKSQASSGNLVPRNISIIIVSNHGSYLDPPILGHSLGRPVAFMAKAELFKIPILSRVIRACGAYPVKRGASDREALRVATQRLEEGWATGVFLDGTRQENGRVNNPMAGAALLAARSGAYLLPVAIINSHRVLPKGIRFPKLCPVHVRVGDLIPPPSSKKKDDLLRTTSLLKTKINQMIDKGLLS